MNYFMKYSIILMVIIFTKHFRTLITSSSLLFKIQCSSSTEKDQFMNQWWRIVSHHRSQIFSINLSFSLLYDELLSSFLIDSSLNHLESLALWNIKFNILISILEKLSSLLPQVEWYGPYTNRIVSVYGTVLLCPRLRG
jgi:hypothetical protein